MSDDKIDLTVEPLVYPDTQDVDEQRRAFVLQFIGDGEIDGRILAENCQLLVEWLKTGVIPEKAKSRPKVEAIKKDA